MEEKNGVASLLKLFGYIIIGLSVISGIYYGTSDSFGILGELQGAIGWGVVIQGLIMGLLFLGIAEIINLLLNIYTKTNARVVSSPVQSSSIVSQTSNPIEKGNRINKVTEIKTNNSNNNNNNESMNFKPVPDRVFEELERYYSQKGVIIQFVKATENEGVFQVKTKLGVENVEMKPGYLPKVLNKDESAKSI